MSADSACQRLFMDVLAHQQCDKHDCTGPPSLMVDETDALSVTTSSSFESIDPHNMEIHISKIFNTEQKYQQQDHGCVEYEVEIPITEYGLLLMLKNRNGAVTFDGYAKKPDGSKGPAECNNLVRNLGDTVVAVNGFVILGLPFTDILKLIKDIVNDNNHGGFMFFTFVDGFEYRNRQDKVNALNSNSMDLNVAYEALENMRKANLEVQFADNIDCTQCTQCLKAYVKKEKELQSMVIDGRRMNRFVRRFKKVQNTAKKGEGKKRPASPTSVIDDSYHGITTSTDRNRKKKTIPKKKHKTCLVCCSPVCNEHSSETFRKANIFVCGECSPLFSIDHIQESLVPKFGKEDCQRRKKHLYRMIEMYDRALLMLKYSSQYIDEVSNSLQESSQRNYRLNSGVRASSLASGITGAVGAATIFTPAGPPLLIASIFFGGSVAAVTTGSEIVTFFSEPNKLADKIILLHAMVKSLMRVTNTLQRIVVDPDSPFDMDEERDDENIIQLPFNRLDLMEKFDPCWVDPGWDQKQEDCVDTNWDQKQDDCVDHNWDQKSGDSSSYSKEVEFITTVARAATARWTKFAGEALRSSNSVTEVNDLDETIQIIRTGSPQEKAKALQSIAKEMECIPETGIISNLCDEYMIQIENGPRKM